MGVSPPCSHLGLRAVLRDVYTRCDRHTCVGQSAARMEGHVLRHQQQISQEVATSYSPVDAPCSGSVGGRPPPLLTQLNYGRQLSADCDSLVNTRPRSCLLCRIKTVEFSMGEKSNSRDRDFFIDS